MSEPIRSTGRRPLKPKGGMTKADQAYARLRDAREARRRELEDAIGFRREGITRKRRHQSRRKGKMS